jgi:acetate kinase
MEVAALARPARASQLQQESGWRFDAMKILVFNSGSSSLKACLYEIGEMPPEAPLAPLWEGKIEWRESSASISVKNRQGASLKQQTPVSSRAQVVRRLLRTASDGETRAITSAAEIDVVGHRVVHGGPHLACPIEITPEVRSAIEGVSSFAPLHIQVELDGVRLVENILGEVPQIAVFDTGFHQQMPGSAAVYPGPYEWFERGIRRYGFHGINHQYCMERAGQLLERDPQCLKLVTCHLGNGCSIAAIRDGHSVDTTMGFTPLDGLMMGTRSGSVDPGVLTYLMREDRIDGVRIDQILNRESGLLGISGLSSDMRDILAGMEQGHERAKLAFDIYVHRVRAAIGAMAAVLEGADAVVFTGGVGENSPQVRAAGCRGLEYAGLRLDSKANAEPLLDQEISTPDSTVRVLVIRAEEDWAIAKQCWKLAHTSRPQQFSVK